MDLAMGEKFVFSDCVQTDGILIVGDSNIHRIQRVTDEDCLAVSGARFVRDKKDFRGALKTTLMKRECSRIYLHLGSNDVLHCAEQDFYKNVTEVLDMVHEARSEIEIVVCVILPRGPDRRFVRGRIPAQKLRAMGRWITSANWILQELSERIKYTRFLSYGKFLVSHHLSSDGLHLNGAGAEWCFEKISRDNMDQQSLTDDSTTTTIATEGEDWPALTNIHIAELGHWDVTYADVVGKTESKVEVKPKKKTEMKMDTSHQDKKKSRKSDRRHKAKHPFEQARARWIRKKFVRNNRMRSQQHPFGYTVLKLSDDVAVEIPACHLSGPCLPKRCATLELDRIHTNTEPRTTPNKAQKQKLIKCPESGCRTVCSRDDFLIDHFIKRHVRDVVQKDSASNTGLKSSARVPEMMKRESPVTTDADRAGHFADSTLTVGAAAVEDLFDDSCLKLMLANDVELNPGPCRWENCAAVFEAYQLCLNHAFDHATSDETCRWTGCPGYNTDFLHGRIQHITRHIYDVRYTVDISFKITKAFVLSIK